MPYLRVETNVAASKAECIALAKKLTGLLEGVLGKPAQYISVSVIPDMALVKSHHHTNPSSAVCLYGPPSCTRESDQIGHQLFINLDAMFQVEPLHEVAH